jgi:hypothetical protein
MIMARTDARDGKADRCAGHEVSAGEMRQVGSLATLRGKLKVDHEASTVCVWSVHHDCRPISIQADPSSIAKLNECLLCDLSNTLPNV